MKATPSGQLTRETIRAAMNQPAFAKTHIAVASATSYRLHAKRYGVQRVAARMRAAGYSLAVALEVLANRRYVRGGDLVPVKLGALTFWEPAKS
jgi:lactam utilization protein B